MDYSKFLERTDFRAGHCSTVYTMSFYVTKKDMEELIKRRKIIVNGIKYKVVDVPTTEWSLTDREMQTVKLDLVKTS